MTLTTPLMALAPQTADAGPRITSMRLISRGIARDEVPHHHAVEVEVDRPAVHERQLRGGQRGGRAPGIDVDVARRDLRDVDARHRAQQVADVRGRGVLNRRAGDDAHGRRRIDQLLFHAGGGHHDLLLEGGRLVALRRRRRRLVLGLAGGGAGTNGKSGCDCERDRMHPLRHVRLLVGGPNRRRQRGYSGRQPRQRKEVRRPTGRL